MRVPSWGGGSLPDVHLLCRDSECVGAGLPAGAVEDEHCRFCGADLADPAGNVLVQGAGALTTGDVPEDFRQLMDALREGGMEVEAVELSAVRVGDALLVSALTESGELAEAEVLDGDRAREVEHVMGMLGGGSIA